MTVSAITTPWKVFADRRGVWGRAPVLWHGRKRGVPAVVLLAASLLFFGGGAGVLCACEPTIPPPNCPCPDCSCPCPDCYK